MSAVCVCDSVCVCVCCQWNLWWNLVHLSDVYAVNVFVFLRVCSQLRVSEEQSATRKHAKKTSVFRHPAPTGSSFQKSRSCQRCITWKNTLPELMETRHLLRTHAVEHFVLLEPKRAGAHLFCADTRVGFLHGVYLWTSIVPFRTRRVTSHLVGIFFETSLRLVSPRWRSTRGSKRRCGWQTGGVSGRTSA